MQLMKSGYIATPVRDANDVLTGISGITAAGIADGLIHGVAGPLLDTVPFGNTAAVAFATTVGVTAVGTSYYKTGSAKFWQK